jgi:hypothetical protein
MGSWKYLMKDFYLSLSFMGNIEFRTTSRRDGGEAAEKGERERGKKYQKYLVEKYFPTEIDR